MTVADSQYTHPAQLLNAVASEIGLPDWFIKLSERYEIADNVLNAIPDGWAKVDGQWFRLQSMDLTAFFLVEPCP